MGEAKPGNLAIEKHDYDPVYGIILPKDKFLKYFEKVKGQWPKDKKSDEIYKQFGCNLPQKNKIILSKKYFLENESLIGIKVFGTPYDTLLKRTLNFEILNLPRKIFDIKDLKIINHVRDLSFREVNSFPRHSIPEFGWTIKYFSGEYKSKDTEEIRDTLSKEEKNLIELLRECNFPEEDIFK